MKYLVLFLIFLGLEYTYFSFIKTDLDVGLIDMFAISILFIILMIVFDNLPKKRKKES